MANQLDVGRLRLLHEVGLRGSIAGAARAVGISASAVSQQLAALERETGTALLDRTARGVELTGAGHVLAGRAAQVLDVLAAASAELESMAGTVGGPVRLAAVTSAAATFVSAAVCALRESTPEVAVSVIAVEPDTAIGLLLDGDVDIAVVDEYDHVPLALPDRSVVRRLCAEPLMLVQHAGTARGGRLVLAAFARHDWVLPPEDAACGRAVRAACRTAGFEPRVSWQTDDMLLLATAVADGHGVTVLPRRAVADLARVDAGALTDPALQRRLLAVARPSVAQRPVVAAVLDSVQAAARR